MSTPLWRWPELCGALGLPVVDGPDIAGVGIDSRGIGPGELFIALPGDPGPRFNASSRSQRDGHDYVGHARRNATSTPVFRFCARTIRSMGFGQLAGRGARH